MLKTLYETLKDIEFDITGHCRCCIGDKWHGHASWCEVGQAINQYEGRYGCDDLPEMSQVRG